MDPSSSSSTRKNTKLSVRRKPTFKKSSFSVNNNLAAKKNTNLAMREQTILRKASELSTLCEIEACVIHYSRDGELINTWPEDQSKVRDLDERFSRLTDKEKLKKSSNLSQFLNKKMNDEKKRSLEGKDDNKFEERVLEIEGSLQNKLQILQDRIRLLLNPKDHHTEPDQSRAAASSSRLSDCGSEQNQNFGVLSCFFSTNSSSSFSLINDPSTNVSSSSLFDDPHLMNGGFATDSLNHPQSKFSVFLYNHDNATFTQLGDSASSSFDQALTPFNNNLMSSALLGAQGFVGSCGNNNIPTLNPLLQLGQLNQTPSYGDPMKFSSSYC